MLTGTEGIELSVQSLHVICVAALSVAVYVVVLLGVLPDDTLEALGYLPLYVD